MWFWASDSSETPLGSNSGMFSKTNRVQALRDRRQSLIEELDRRDKKGDVLSDLITMNKKTNNFSGEYYPIKRLWFWVIFVGFYCRHQQSHGANSKGCHSSQCMIIWIQEAWWCLPNSRRSMTHKLYCSSDRLPSPGLAPKTYVILNSFSIKSQNIGCYKWFH